MKDVRHSEKPQVAEIRCDDRSTGSILIRLAVSIAIYVLSVGPVTGIYDRTASGSPKIGRALEKFYFPVIALDRHCGGIFTKYVDWSKKALKRNNKYGERAPLFLVAVRMELEITAAPED